MKISHTKVLITFLFYIDVALLETIEIKRYIPGGKLKNWKDVVDSIHIPQSVCHEESSGYGNFCNTSCTMEQAEAGSQGPYSCPCSNNSATATYLNNKWTCLENQEVRNQLGKYFVLFVRACIHMNTSLFKACV